MNITLPRATVQAALKAMYRDTPRHLVDASIEALRKALAQPQAEPSMTREQEIALREAHAITACEKYFEPRKVWENYSSLMGFHAGFERGWKARGEAQPQAEPSLDAARYRWLKAWNKLDGWTDEAIDRQIAIDAACQTDQLRDATEMMQPTSWQQGSLVTFNQDHYPSLGQWFVQFWDGDEVVARVYANDRETLDNRCSILRKALAQPPVNQQFTTEAQPATQQLPQGFSVVEVNGSAVKAWPMTAAQIEAVGLAGEAQPATQPPDMLCWACGIAIGEFHPSDLAQPATQQPSGEPVGHIDGLDANADFMSMALRQQHIDRNSSTPSKYTIPVYLAPQPAGEPVAWASMLPDGTVGMATGAKTTADLWAKSGHNIRELAFCTPQPRKLTDKELEVVIYEHTKLNPNQQDDRELIGYIIKAVRSLGIGGQA